MKYLNVDQQSMAIAVEELELLVTELSGDQLVDAPDVQEELQEEILEVGVLRESIAEIGMTRDAAVQVGAAVESFLLHNPLRNFTREASIEGLAPALEALDQKRANILQRFAAWLRDRFNKAIAWLSSLFKRGGKAEAAVTKAKEMAEEVSNERNPKSVAEMVKDPKTAAQGVRIDPADEKSGTFEDFSEALEKNIAPIQGDVAAMYERISKNKVLRIAIANDEAVKSFFDQMERSESTISGVRTVLDNIAASLRDLSNVAEAAQKVKVARLAIYRELGGNDEGVLDTIRQQQFTETNDAEITPDSLSYDKLIEAVTAVTRNSSAANSEARIRDLEFLAKAVDEVGKIGETNAVMKLSDADRDMLLNALNGLLKDVSRYQSASMENWNYVLQLYTGISSFFSSELSIYYRTIAAIQRAATQTLSGADREALYQNFKKQGFNLDLSAEDLQRRGVGTESFIDFDVRPMGLGLEAFGMEELPEFPFQEPIKLGGGLLAALEAETQEAQGDGKQRFSKLREWFAKIVAWFKNLFVKTKKDAVEKVQQAKEVKTKQDEAVKTAVSAKQAANVEAALRPEIKALFEKYVQDAGWWKESGFAEKTAGQIGSHFPTRMAVSPEAMKEYVPAVAGARESAMAFVKEIAAAKTLEEVTALANSKNWDAYGQFIAKMSGTGKLTNDGRFNTLADLVQNFAGSQQQLPVLGKISKAMTADLDLIDNVVGALQDKMNTWQNTEANSPALASASKFFKSIQQLSTMHARNLSAVSEIEFVLITSSILSRQEKVRSIFAAAKKADANAPVYDSHELVILMSDDVWGITSVAVESMDMVCCALESLDAVMVCHQSEPFFDKLNFALEAEGEPAEQRAGFLDKVKAILARILEWVKNLFKKKQETKAEKVQVVKEFAQKRAQKVEAAKPEPMRDEVRKVFDSYWKDASWYKGSAVRDLQQQSITQSSVAIVYGNGGAARYVSDMKAIVQELNTFASTYSNVNDLNGIAAIEAGSLKLSSDLIQRSRNEPEQRNTLAEQAAALMAVVGQSNELTRISTDVDKAGMGIEAALEKMQSILNSTRDADPAKVVAAQKVIETARAAVVIVNNLSSIAMSVYLEVIMGQGVRHSDAIKEIFNHYNQKPENKDSQITIGESDIVKLEALPQWATKSVL